MKPSEIARRRLHAQLIAGTSARTPAEAVARLGAVQSQDYGAGKWAVGLRVAGATEETVDRAIADRTIVRTWPMRGTIHFVAAPDVRWMLELLTPHIVARAARRRRELELDDAVFLRTEKILVKALQGGRRLSREAVYAVLGRNGVPADASRGYHILWRLAQEGLLCFAAPDGGKKPTFALLEEWVPAAKRRDRHDALAELAYRYVAGHGPASVADFCWWSGLKAAEAREGIALAAPRLEKVVVDGVDYWMVPGGEAAPQGVFLLPAFDEYLLGYREREAVLDPRFAERICPGGNGIFLPMLVIDGKVEGIWKRAVKKKSVTVTPEPFTTLSAAAGRALPAAAGRYGHYLGLSATLA